jgi:hypothetical protein
MVSRVEGIKAIYIIIFMIFYVFHLAHGNYIIFGGGLLEAGSCCVAQASLELEINLH